MNCATLTSAITPDNYQQQCQTPQHQLQLRTLERERRTSRGLTACLRGEREEVEIHAATKKRYIVHNQSYVTFYDAWRRCQGFGQRLATVTSKEDSELLESTIKQLLIPFGVWWIGGTDEGKEGYFTWISTNEPVGKNGGYTNFYPLQPSDFLGLENCLEVGRFGGVQWNDANCYLLQRFICEADVEDDDCNDDDEDA